MTAEPTPTDPQAPPADGDPAAQQGATTDWQAEARKWEKRAKDNKAKLDEAAPVLTEYEALKAASQTDLERAQGEASRWQQDSQRWRTTAVSSRIQALAGSFADPTDATSALADPGKYISAGGDIDDAAIQVDLAAVLEAKPHWRKQDGASGPRPPAPNPAQGFQGQGPTDPAAQFASFLHGQMSR